MGAKTDAVEVIGKSLLEEKAKHSTSMAIAGTGVSTGTIIGYSVAALAALSSIYVMYKTYLEIRLIRIRISNEQQIKA